MMTAVSKKVSRPFYTGSPGYKLQVSSKMKIFCFFSVIMGTKSRKQILGGLGVLCSEILMAKNPEKVISIPDTVCYLL